MSLCAVALTASLLAVARRDRGHQGGRSGGGRRWVSSLALAVSAVVASGWAALPVEPPTPFGPIPSARQLRWQEMELVGFLHFGINTFTDREWGYGDEDEALFNPSAFDADEIVRVAKDAGMEELILTAKHHDGFCLWPSALTAHSVAHSPWRGGKGDVVQEIAAACRKHGLRFGVYLSPWDRNHKDYGRPEYIVYYRNQLRELLTKYGAISEVWFDGANGGDGFYGGARETRTIDRLTYYSWPTTWQLVRDLQPSACIFSDAGPDVRWVGNERGEAGETCWAGLDTGGFAPGHADEKRLTSGDRHGPFWVPAECDVSSEDLAVKNPEQLLDLYFASVGRGAVLLLNVPPDRRGRIHDNDARALSELRRRLDAIFDRDLARGAKVTASDHRGNDSRFAPGNVVDGHPDTYWATGDFVTTPELVLDFEKPVTFDVVRVREHLPLGQRVDAFALDRWQDGQWIELAALTSIGACRLVRFPAVTTTRFRMRVVRAAACPAISELGLFLMKP
jgi:alpha-L-fucosidase